MIPILICVLTSLIMILSVLFFPKLKLGKVQLGTYWMITLVGGILLLALGYADITQTLSALTQNTAVNPLKILVLFISMTVLSVYLDEMGFFSYLAYVTLQKARTSQLKLFLYLYLIVSVLTVFTSNDVIILSFTPFICYFSKNAKINPIPYLATEFVSANSWSMALIIGNPTNIYLATSYGITFAEYTKNMILPTLGAGIVSFAVLFLVYRKKLSVPLQTETLSLRPIRIQDKPDLILGVVLLALCTACLAVSAYIEGIEMWMISLGAVVLLFILVSLSSLFRKRKPKELITCLKRAPWELIPFVLSMFVMIIVLTKYGVTEKIASFLSVENWTTFTFGGASFLFSNLINNIPMSVLFCSVIDSVPTPYVAQAVYATVIGSNLGAFLTPIGALAGIMWSSILNNHGIKFNYIDFLKIGIVTSVPTLIASLAILYYVIA